MEEVRKKKVGRPPQKAGNESGDIPKEKKKVGRPRKHPISHPTTKANADRPINQQNGGFIPTSSVESVQTVFVEKEEEPAVIKKDLEDKLPDTAKNSTEKDQTPPTIILESTIKETSFDQEDQILTENSNQNPYVVSKEVKEAEEGSFVIETKFKGNGSTKVAIYMNGKQYNGEESARFCPEVLETDEEDLYLVRISVKNANSRDSGLYTVFLAQENRRVIIDYDVTVSKSFEKLWLTTPAECIQQTNGGLRLKFGIRSFKNNFASKWFHNNKEIPKSKADYIQRTKRNGEQYEIYLDIKHPMLDENAGNYRCVVQSSHNSVRADFLVEIEDKRPSSVKPPTIDIKKEGEDGLVLIMTVEYKSELDATVTWRHKKKGIFTDDGEQAFSIITKQSDSSNTFRTQFKLNNYAFSGHSGLYTCEVNNDYGSLVAELNVLEDEESVENNA